MSSSLPIRVYYEDTDAAGIVYHGNYLRYAERGRTEWLRDRGIDQIHLFAKDAIRFVVAHVEIKFESPARLDDVIMLRTELIWFRRVVGMFLQSMWLDNDTHRRIATLRVKTAIVDAHGQLIRKPSKMLEQWWHAHLPSQWRNIRSNSV